MNRKRIFGAAIAILLAVTLIFGTQVNSASAGEVPIGTITAYGGLVDDNAKGQLQGQGWLACDGGEYSRADYPELFTIIGGSFGSGDNIKTFNVPDLRGRFVRGVDSGAGRDPDAKSRTASATGGSTGDRVGSLQGDEFKSHSHEYISPRRHSENESNEMMYPTQYRVNQSYQTSEEGGAETRPKNIYVNWIIKAKNVD